MPSNSIWSVYEDHTGTLWVITAEGLARFKNNRFDAITIREGLSDNSISAVVEGSDGSLWIGTGDGLDRLIGSKIIAYHKVDGLLNNTVHALCIDTDGKLWIGTQEGLQSFDGLRFSTYTKHQGLPDNDIATLNADAMGRVWIGSAAGLAVFDHGKITAYTIKDGLPGNRIGTIYADREGSVWISTNRGLARFSDGRLTVFTPKEGLSSNIVLSIYEDREGSLWLGTESGGLNQLRDQKFITYTTAEGLSDDVIRSVFQDRHENIWIGTNGGGLNRFEKGRFTTYTTDNGLASNIILALSDGLHSNLWVGTPDGLSRFHDGKFTTITTADGLPDDFVRSIYEDREGALWLGSRRGLTRMQGGRFTTYTTLDGLAGDLVGALLQSHDGGLWVGTLGGLSLFKDGKFTNYTIKNGLSSNIITTLHADREGVIWIGTSGGGLNRLKDGKVTRYNSNQVLPDELFQILEDGQDNLWMSSSKGIFRVSKKELNDFADGRATAISTVSFGTADGMKISECSGGGHPSGWKSKDGKLWFSTIKGVSLIDPENSRLNTLSPPVAVEQVWMDDELVDASEQAEFPPGHARISFHYSGLSFVAPQKVRYRYKLEGFDKDWVDADTRRVAYYTNVPPGHYRFRVLASNNDGVWNENGATFAFHLQPHFYQTYWFYGLCVVLFGLISWQIYRLRVKRMESQFAAVLAERGRIAREIHDTLAQGFVGISVQLEVVTRMLNVSPAEAIKEQLDQARIQVRNSLAEARRSVWDLRSHDVEEGGLAGGFSKTAKLLTANTAIQVRFQVSGSYRDLPHEVETHLLRLGQEAISNAVRHAQAKQIHIDLQFDTKHLRLSVRDDGIGFSGQPTTSASEGHFGLVGMRERAQQIGGKLNVNSIPGEGTEISVDVIID